MDKHTIFFEKYSNRINENSDRKCPYNGLAKLCRHNENCGCDEIFNKNELLAYYYGC